MKDEIIEIGQKVLEIEKETLNKLMNYINEDFVSCVEYLLAIKGRIVVTGVGKSAIIAQKIVATFNSTGTPAVFMHAADAVHGDLGMITKEDAVLCISKSGETSEIKVLISVLKNFGNKIIAMTSNNDSYLALNSDFLLYIPIDIEAEPNNLAPTASSIAQMAIGDALATTLLKIKGFSSEQFAKFHPGGSLGKQLYLRVSDLYQQNEKPAVEIDAGIKTIIMEMTSKRLGATAVLDDNGLIRGIITDGDLRRMLKTNIDLNKITAKDIMSASPRTIKSDKLAVI
ncbi:MAG TPA: KpsF/GutQ family sugar-phosphate isomerase, partial [Bacteroidetes bacterium]|nr:KpsF/GutQ family sugar-phosphate isomerase [Bacteroidota bacterium]